MSVIDAHEGLAARETLADATGDLWRTLIDGRTLQTKCIGMPRLLGYGMNMMWQGGRAVIQSFVGHTDTEVWRGVEGCHSTLCVTHSCTHIIVRSKLGVG